MVTMFHIKICGLTTAEDARAACEAGADALGLNFYSGSRRCISPASAAQIATAVPRDRVSTVGVFVNMPAASVVQTCDRFRLDAVQLHGDEPPEMLVELGDRRIIRAFRCRDASLSDVEQYLIACRRLGRLPDAVLIDAYSPGEFGGTGCTVDWSTLAAARTKLLGLPLVLAGGLRPDNVADAIRTVGPAAVDTASGVEASPGIKDRGRLCSFIAQARAAFETTHPT